MAVSIGRFGVLVLVSVLAAAGAAPEEQTFALSFNADAAGDALSRTTAWNATHVAPAVGHLVVSRFFGRDVPTFSAADMSCGWGYVVAVSRERAVIVIPSAHPHPWRIVTLDYRSTVEPTWFSMLTKAQGTIYSSFTRSLRDRFDRNRDSAVNVHVASPDCSIPVLLVSMPYELGAVPGRG
jgi:hypothetical protein